MSDLVPPAIPMTPKDFEAESLVYLWKMIDMYAPHLGPSFVRSERWWELNQGLPEAHVGLETGVHEPHTHFSHRCSNTSFTMGLRAS